MSEEGGNGGELDFAAWTEAQNVAKRDMADNAHSGASATSVTGRDTPGRSTQEKKSQRFGGELVRGGTPRKHRSHSHGLKVAAMLGSVAAQRDAIEREWQEMAVGQIKPTDPGSALLEGVSWCAAFVRWLRMKLADLDVDEVLWGQTKEIVRTGGKNPGVDQVWEARAHALLVLIADWTDRLARISAQAIRAGVEVRRLELHERLGVTVAEILVETLGDLDLDPAVEQRARAMLARRMLRLSGGVA